MEYQLIELIKANPILYDKKYRNPRYKDEKMDKWNEVALELGRDPSTLRIRWKTLRDTYLRERTRKLREDQKDESERSHYTWKYYHELEFLNNQMKEPAIDCKIEDGEFAQFIQDTSSLNDQEVVNEVEFEVENFDLNEYIKKIDTSTVSVTNLSKAASSDDAARKRKVDKDAIINEACREISSLLKNAKQRFTPPSPNQVFFNSMALQVEEANLQPIDLMRLQQRVLEVVTQELIMFQDRTYAS